MNYNPFSLEGKKILVTGASSGIGKATAIECSKMGATVYITGRNEERLNQTFSLLEGEPANHQQIIADLQIETELARLVDVLPTLDGIVHSAGSRKTLLFPFVNQAEIDLMLGTNFTIPTLLSQSLIKKKKMNKGASIVFISSVSGVWVAGIGTSLYSASKGAINGLVKGMALDLAPKKIRVNCVNPGVIQTEIFAEGIITEEQLREDAQKNYPLKRHGQPHEVAHAAIYLLSNASSWVTGTNLLIDGGLTLL